uniref:Cytochrome c oxidase assembly factor 7 homolog n=2 Tax=Biomphalaria glabrata TaxID=6526 RepID=A0A2C9L702_BIOGL
MTKMARGYDLTSDAGTKEYLRDVEIEYQFQCLDQKEVDGCHRLGEFLENIRKNTTAAAAIYKENCDKGNYARSCLKYGHCLNFGKGVKEDKTAALQYFEKTCKLGNGSGCFYAGHIDLKLSLAEGKTPDKAVQLMSQSCDLKCSEGCFILASWHLLGRYTDKDLRKAFELNQKGCNLENVGCCSNLSIMYRHGHGTNKDLSLATEMKKRAEQYSADHLKKQPVLKVNE